MMVYTDIYTFVSQHAALTREQWVRRNWVGVQIDARSLCARYLETFRGIDISKTLAADRTAMGDRRRPSNILTKTIVVLGSIWDIIQGNKFHYISRKAPCRVRFRTASTKVRYVGAATARYLRGQQCRSGRDKELREC